MTNSTTTYYSVAETAKFLRAALKTEFPGIVFSVRSKSYSGGASITIYWTDGPTSAQVKAVSSLFEGAEFDGMIDLKSYHASPVLTPDGPKMVHYGADFVFENRRHSVDLLTRVYLRACRKYGVAPTENPIHETTFGGAELTNAAAFVQPFTNSHDQMRDLVYRMLSKSFLHNGILVEVKS